MLRTSLLFLLVAIVTVGLINPVPTLGVYLPNPIKCPDLLCVFTDVIRLVLGVLGLFGVFMFIYGGIVFMTSGGNPEQVRKGKDTLRFATLGIVITIVSWIIVRTILTAVSRGTF